VPGDNAARSIADARASGVRYDAATWRAIVGWAERLHVDVPAAR
jgi:LDH2 family malate/lactate/ureidoglycolate dehydrogenase